MQILTDQGPNCESELFKELCHRMSVDKIRTTAYKPSTNGNIERFHATLNSILAKWVSENHRDWDDKLPAVAFAYRTSIQESTGFTPFFLLHGREARVPADLVYGPPEADHFTSTVEFVAKQQQKLREGFETVRRHLGTSAVRRKEKYDMRTRPAKKSQSAHGFGASYHAAVQNAVTSGRVSTKGHFSLPKNLERSTSKYSEHPDLVQLLYILTNSSHDARTAELVASR